MRRSSIAALATAAVLLTGCSTASGSQDNRPTRAPAAEAVTGPAADCFVDVSNALVLAFRAASSQPSGGDEEAAMGAFYVKHDGGPEITIYEKFSGRGATKIAKDSVAGVEITEQTPVNTAATYAASVKAACNKAYSD